MAKKLTFLMIDFAFYYRILTYRKLPYPATFRELEAEVAACSKPGCVKRRK